MAIKSGETTYHQAKRGIVQNGLVVNLDPMYHLNTSSSAADLSGLGNNMALSNFDGMSKESSGLIISLDGSDDKGEIPDTNDDFKFESSAYSICFWFWCRQGGFNQGATINPFAKAKHSNPMTGSYWNLGVFGNGLSASSPQITSNGNTESGSSFVYSQWQYLVSTNSAGHGGTTKVYRNGSLLFSGTTSHNSAYYTSGYPLRIGTAYGWNASFDYKLGPVQLYDKELTATEVLQNYNATRHRFGV